MDLGSKSIIDHRSNCGNKKTTTQKLFNYRTAWETIDDMGITTKIQEKFGYDVMLKLQEYDVN